LSVPQWSAFNEDISLSLVKKLVVAEIILLVHQFKNPSILKGFCAEIK
jgi:hypothetical protein